MFCINCLIYSVTAAMSNGSGICVRKKRSFSTQSAKCLQIQSKATPGRYLNTNPVERVLLQLDGSGRWNSSFQALRLEKEWNDLSQCRTMKKNSQTMFHRVDKKYVMSGAQIPLRPRYEVDDEELRTLKEFSRARKTSQRELRKKSSCRHYKQDDDHKSDETPQPVVAGSSGHWASERTKTPIEKTEEETKDTDSSSSFDESMKGKDGEGKTDETVDRGKDDVENKVTNEESYNGEINDSAIVNNSDAKRERNHVVEDEEEDCTKHDDDEGQEDHIKHDDDEGQEEDRTKHDNDDGQGRNENADTNSRKSSHSSTSGEVTVEQKDHHEHVFSSET
ncbi:sarcoplasmic reticulum histidine-rich calcium-binding protein-like isoform X2 [Gigantopelta aegis]|uniref:sarcoplasmic reticulum histidine-rich calcium-binding protein-like isoform X2 n=1 Tax=Gigantopelta aegis TaxID=1735272 RepID=UPI001B8887F2|nr:sarcoplasmic reticulum histidine-rich calcium-binding protein-like isoform X2 [Gigantopelta aegis]